MVDQLELEKRNRNMNTSLTLACMQCYSVFLELVRHRELFRKGSLGISGDSINLDTPDQAQNDCLRRLGIKFSGFVEQTGGFGTNVVPKVLLLVELVD